MPALEQTIIDGLTDRLALFLRALGGYGEPVFLDAGGSAAVYRVPFNGGSRVFKVFNPFLFSGQGGDAEKRRLDVQRRLIGHDCKSLIQTYRVEEAESTAFVEMEFVSWPKLKTNLSEIPDNAIVPLIGQLVDAVKFLETLNIVHRDIKPENIHVSEDFTKLKLLDLGVAREFDWLDKDEAAITDHGQSRRFLATAQYSSPEYLFRLDEPTSKLWRGLNFYQIGAVLHDLIMKEEIFKHEIKLENRWLVARAVLTKSPTFKDASPDRLLQLKALAARCLAKDLDARLRLVGWDDFLLEGAKDPLAALRGRLAKGRLNAGGHADASSAARLEFDRVEFVRRFADRIRAELISTCGTQLPLTTHAPAPGAPPNIKFIFAFDKQISIGCEVSIEWLEQLYERTANIKLAARIICSGRDDQPTTPPSCLVCTVAILEGEDEGVISLCGAIASAVAVALDRIESTAEATSLHGIDLCFSDAARLTQ